MFSNVVVIPIASILFSGISTLVFFITTAGRVPSYLECSGSFIGSILAVSGYTRTGNSSFNQNTAPVQGAIFILSLVYMAISFLVMLVGYHWLEFFMPPIVTGSIIAGIGFHLSFISYRQATSTSFDSYLAIATALIVMLISVYAPTQILKRIALLLGTVIGYFIYAMCGLKDIGPGIDYSGIVSSAWIKVPPIGTHFEFHSSAISTIMPILIVLLAENLGHMKAIGSITNRPMLKHMGRAYLGDAVGCLLTSLGGTLPSTTYAENIGVLSVTRVFSPLVIVFAALFAILLGFFAKFNAVVRSIPDGVLAGVMFVLYALIAMTGIRIWVTSRIDFNSSQNIFIGGIPVLIAVVLQTPVQLGNFQLDGIGAATFGAIILNQLLQGCDGMKRCYPYIRKLKTFFSDKLRRTSLPNP
ncbi:Xanthine/uracil/vitamin C permease [Choanephora cucurbitarum]|nr:Xanthine/uracil/vitamin C permease [Choanephora cucurbitarum]